MEAQKDLKVDFGCGIDKPEGFIGVDICPNSHADVVHNLEEAPYPFEDNSVAEVHSAHNIEHLSGLDTFVDEIHRICKPGAIMIIKFPHYSRSWFSAQHKRAYGIRIFNDYKAKLEVLSIKFNYKHHTWRSWYWPFCKVVNFFANLSPRFCERVWCYWFGGFDYVIMKVKIKK